MFGDALVAGIIIMLSLLVVIAVVVGLLIWRSRSDDRVSPGTVPPPVDPGRTESRLGMSTPKTDHPSSVE